MTTMRDRRSRWVPSTGDGVHGPLGVHGPYGVLSLLTLFVGFATACGDAIGVDVIPSEITLTVQSDTVWSIGVRARITATAVDADGAPLDLEALGATWTSTNAGVASVEPGFVMPLAEGSTTVRVEVGGVSGAQTITIRDNAPFTVTPALAEAFQWSIEDTLAIREVVGMTASVLMPDGTGWSGSAGWSAPGEERMEPSMTFPVGSISKSFVAGTALALVEAGVLSLDDTVGDWLSPIDFVDGGIGLRLLMSQTSGLAAFSAHPEWGPAIEADLDRVWSPDELLGRFMAEPIFAPGERYASSITNMFLTGLMIREATGVLLSETLRDRIIEPLGLTGTSFSAEERLRGTTVRVWTVVQGSLVETTMYEAPALFSSRWASSGVYSRAADVARWGQALFTQELFGPAVTQEMLQFRSTDGVFTVPGIGAQDGSGLGVRRYRLNGRVYYGHSGVTAGASTEMLFDPESGIVTAVLVNQSPLTHGFVHFRAALALMEMARTAL
jgi:D-alanyl-D-alanine carboxypeptidase